MADPDSHLNEIKEYFRSKIERFGTTPQGADWNSAGPQEIRFAQLLQVVDTTEPFSILDFGCGYGALVEYLQLRGMRFSYWGFDLVEEMVQRGRELHPASTGCRFTSRAEELEPVDFSIASGTFNQKAGSSNEEWTELVLRELARMHELSRRGFASNFLTSYSDPEYMREDLYYADPCFLFDYCKRRFSRNVALLHDYGRYDFTLIVRRQEAP